MTTILKMKNKVMWVSSISLYHRDIYHKEGYVIFLKTGENSYEPLEKGKEEKESLPETLCDVLQVLP